MSDYYNRLGFGQEDTEQEESYYDRLFGTPTLEERIRADPLFGELKRVQSNLTEATVRTTLAGANDITNTAEALRQDLATKYNVSGDVLDSLLEEPVTEASPPVPGFIKRALKATKGAVDAVEKVVPDPVEKFGGNVFRGAMGLLEPIALIPDATRAYTSNLEEVTGNKALSAFGVNNPFKTPFAVPRAAFQTAKDLKLIGEDSLSGESGWNVYFPSLIWGDFKLGKSPTGGPVTGREWNEQFGIYELTGVENEAAKEWMGLGTEILYDPTLAAGWMFSGARTLGVTAKVTRSSKLAKAANKLEDVGRGILEATSPKGVAKIGTQVARGVAPDLVDRSLKSMDGAINRVLDMEAPGVFRDTDSAEVAKSFGFPNAGQGLGVKWRDVLFQRGRTPVGSGGNRPAWLTGGETYGLSAAQEAFGMQNRVQRIAVHGIKELNDIASELVGKPRAIDIPKLGIRLPGARVIPPEKRGFLNGMGANVWDFVDNHGVVQSSEAMATYLPRIKRLAKTYGVAEDSAIDVFKRSLDSARQTTLELGYEVTGYEAYTNAMKQAAGNLGMDYTDMRSLLEVSETGMDIGKMLATGQLPTGRQRLHYSEETAKNLELFKSETRRVLEAEGNPFSHIAPEAFLKGIRDGYMRRVFAGKYDPEKVIDSIATRRTVLLKELDIAGIKTRMTEFYGEEAGELVEGYLKGRPPSGVIQAEEVAKLLQRRGKLDVGFEEVANVLYKDDGDYTFLEETLALLRGNATIGGTNIPVPGAVFARRPGAFQARKELSPEQLTMLVQMADPETSIASLGLAGGRALRSQTFLNTAYRELKKSGLLQDAVAIEKKLARNATEAATAKRVLQGMDEAGQANPESIIWGFMGSDGVKYVVIPENRAAWGPLAGHAVPEDIAREIVRALSRRNPKGFERYLSMVRRGMLSPLPTAMRNILGGLVMIQQAGGDMFGVMGNLKRAHKARKTFYRTGKADELDDAEHLMPFLSESGMATSLSVPLEEHLERLSNIKTVGGVTQFFEGLTDKVTHQPMLGGFLGLFRWGEETTRLATYMWMRDNLIKRGVAKGEAIRRAAHFANNATYDYGSLPAGPELLRRYGLSWFPAFTYFTIGRTARTLAERPGVFQKQHYAYEAANLAVTPDREEQERISGLMADWQRYSHPLAIPLPNKDGSYLIANLDFLFPQGAGTGAIFQQPFMGGAGLPIIESAMAHYTGTGEAPVSARYGERVFDPSKGGVGRAVDTLQFLLNSYVFPGQTRQAERLAETIQYNGNREMMEKLGRLQGHYYNLRWSQYVARMLGLSTYEMDVTGDISFKQRISDLEWDYRNRTKLLRRQLDEAIQRGDEAEINRLWARMEELDEEKFKRFDRIFELIRDGSQSQMKGSK